MCTDRDPPRCEHDDLIGKVDRLQDRNARLTAANKELCRQLAAAQRAGKRQAAPFSRADGPQSPGVRAESPAWGASATESLRLTVS